MCSNSSRKKGLSNIPPAVHKAQATGHGTPPTARATNSNHVLLRTNALGLRLLEVGELPAAVQQGVPDGRDVRAEASLRHHLPAGAVQALRPGAEEAPPRPQDADRHREVAAGGQPGGYDREDGGGHPGDQRPNTGVDDAAPREADEGQLIAGGKQSKKSDKMYRCVGGVPSDAKEERLTGLADYT